MELAATNGDRLSLEILGFEFPTAAQAVERDYDTSWLIVAGHVVHGPHSWGWRDACMTRLEAVRLSQWLRAVADGDVRANRVTVEDHGAEQLGFLEPVIGFNLGGRAEDEATIQVFLAHESLPSADSDGPRLIDLTMDLEQVASAASAWDAQVRSLAPGS